MAKKHRAFVCACAPLSTKRPRSNPAPKQRTVVVHASRDQQISRAELQALRPKHFVRIVLKTYGLDMSQESVWAQIDKINRADETLTLILRNSPIGTERLKWGDTVTVPAAALIALHKLPREGSSRVNDFAAT